MSTRILKTATRNIRQSVFRMSSLLICYFSSPPLLSELLYEAAVHGGFRLVFLRKSENIDKAIVQYTIGCLRYNVHGVNKKKVPSSNTFKGKHIGPDKLHADDIKKTAINGGGVMKGTIWMEGNSHGEDTRCFLLRNRKGVLSD
jgi:hypothetical protein